jgi:hypothetical protein
MGRPADVGPSRYSNTSRVEQFPPVSLHLPLVRTDWQLGNEIAGANQANATFPLAVATAASDDGNATRCDFRKT